MKTFSVVTILLVSICMVGGMLLLSSCDRDGEESAGFEPISQPNAPVQWHSPQSLTSLNSTYGDIDDWQVSINDTGTIMFFSTQDIYTPDPDRCPFGMHSAALRSQISSNWGGPFVGSDGCSELQAPGMGGGINPTHSILYYVSAPDSMCEASMRPGAMPDYTQLPQTEIYQAFRQGGPIDPDRPPGGDYLEPIPFHVGGDTTSMAPDYGLVAGASNPAVYETTPAVDNRNTGKLFFARSDDGTDFDIYCVNLYDNPGLEEIEAVNSSSHELYPYVTTDFLGNDCLYFASNRPGGEGGYDIWVSVKDSTGWQTPVNTGHSALDLINTSDNEIAPYVRFDLNEFYFSSDQTGDFDLYWSKYY